MQSAKSIAGNKLAAFGWLKVGVMVSLLAIAAFAVVALYSLPDQASAQSNQAPVIGALPTDLTIAENASGNVGSPFTATDPDGGAISWSVGGADGDEFSMDSASGQLSVTTGLDYTGLNYEDGATRSLTVIASDGTDSDSVAVTVGVSDVDEPPGKPAPPRVLHINGVVGGVDFAWSAPANTGPAINNYTFRLRNDDVYSTDPDPPWLSGDEFSIGLKYEIAFILRVNEKKEFQLQAVNPEGGSEWSDSNYLVVKTATAGNTRPVIHTRSVVGLEINENTAGAVGDPIVANEQDEDDTLSWSLSGTDAAEFAISSSGQLSVASADGLDYEAGATRSLRVTVSDGTDSDSEDVTVTVTDVKEPSGRLAAPAVTANSTTSLTVTWSAPTNTGPPITRYYTHYCIDSTGGNQNSKWRNYPSTTNTTTTITGLRKGETYQVRVRAENDAGESPWSASGAGATSTDNNAPVIGGADCVTIEVAENATGNIGSAFTATDADGDTITWSVGGAAGDEFSISSAGQLSVKSATGLNDEDGVLFQLTVTASDGTDSGSVTVYVQVSDEI